MKSIAIIVAGVAGSGKTTLATALATALGWHFIEADDFHSATARTKMANGQPLDDNDRLPWLNRLNAEIQRRAPATLSCSALKHQYRQELSANVQSFYIWLNISPELAQQRVSGRDAHFMPASLVASQFQIASVPNDALVLDASLPLNQLVEQSLAALGPQIVAQF